MDTFKVVFSLLERLEKLRSNVLVGNICVIFLES